MLSTSDVELYENVTPINWPQRCSIEDPQLANFWKPMLEDCSAGHNTSLYIANTDITSFSLLRMGKSWYPITLSKPVQLFSAPYSLTGERSYCCSLYSHYVLYAYDDMHKLVDAYSKGKNRLLAILITLLLKATIILLSFVFYIVGMDNTVLVNNWLLSTNIYCKIEKENIVENLKKATETLASFAPDRYIVFRSLESVTSPVLIQSLVDLGYILIPARLIHFADTNKDNGAIFSKYNNKCDGKLVEKSLVSLYDKIPLNKDTDKDFLRKHAERLSILYQYLYLDKYSKCNPQFTPKFIYQHIISGHFQGIGLLSKATGEFDVYFCFFVRNGWATPPLVGYDIHKPASLGLYRMYHNLFMKTVHSLDGEIKCHMSGGAGEFKKLRGAVSTPEFIAIYCNHLPFYKSIPWRIVYFLLSNVASILTKNLHVVEREEQVK